ncbi:MAG TPA: hypothetical protein VIC51_07680 [Psychromonas sp.]
MNFYDNDGKLEGKITECSDGYTVKYGKSILGIYKTKEQAVDAFNDKKLFSWKLKKMMDDRYEANNRALKIFTVISIAGLVMIAIMIIMPILYCE